MFHPQEAFAQIRSLMHQERLSQSQREGLWTLMMLAKKTNITLLKEQWIPYVQQFEHHWVDPWIELNSWIQVQELSELFHFARSALCVRAKASTFKPLFLWQECATQSAADSLGALDYRQWNHSSNTLDEVMLPLVFPSLRRLSFWALSCSLELVQHLVAPKTCPNLTHLALRGCGLKGEHFHDLMQSPSLRGLQTLNLRNNHLLTAEDHHDLAQSPLFGSVRSLNLNQTQCRGTGLIHLTRASIPHLKHLNLGQNRLTNADAQLLADWPGLSGVEALHLNANEIGDEGIIALANSPYLSNLHTLSIGHNDYSTPGVLAVASSPRLKRLKFVDFGLHYWTSEARGKLSLSPLRDLSTGRRFTTFL